ncbi:MAG: DUF3472 domain-containing protein [Ruminococcus flavefaciens]|nr:DUF3472 domain-containing protein [Ruminococcus flavefaciens]
MGDKKQATNMYVDWNISSNSFNMILVDFYCDIQAIGTYWAVLNWNNGYAGFQNDNSRHITMFSIWDNGNLQPQIEYYIQGADENNFDFSGEGTGKHIYTNVQWSMNKWYGMAVGTKSFGGNTYYMHWLRKPNNDWQLIGIISFPVENLTLNKSSVFQEDFANNEDKKRRCRVKHSYGRNSKTNKWVSWNTGTVKSCYYPTEDSSGEWNTQKNCNCGKGTDNDEEYVFIESGGENYSSSNKIPFDFNLDSPDSPTSYPEFPKCIKSKYSGLFVSHNGSKVVQSEKKYWWNFVDAGSGYVYIKSSDNKQALTVTTMDDGSDLAFSDFESGNIKQQWKIQEDVNGLSYIRPRAVPSKTMDIEGSSGDEGAIIQIWTYNTHAEQFKWYIL